MKGLKFKFVNDEHIDIIIDGKDKIVGQIFTPSGSGNNVKNAIQVCGFSEAFDLWGCGVFGEENKTTKEYSKDKIKLMKKYRGVDIPKTYIETKTIMKKDVQLLFDEYDKKRASYLIHNSCVKCYNEPCTCDSLVIKTQKELEEQGVIELTSK